jgi:hypothetical protein
MSGSFLSDISTSDWLKLAGTVYGAYNSSQAAKDAANAQSSANQAAINAQMGMYNTTRNDNAPYRYVGNQALNSLAAANGLNPYADVAPATGGAGGAPRGIGNAGNGMAYPGSNALAVGGTAGGGSASFPGQAAGSLGSFTASPGYNFVRNEGQRNVEQSAAARGGAFSGNAMRALADYNQNIASKEYDNWYSRMANLAGFGPAATNTVTAAGVNAANSSGNYMNSTGMANASGIIGQSNAINNGINGAAKIFGTYG